VPSGDRPRQRVTGKKWRRKSVNSGNSQTLAVCFGQFGLYHHARVAALQEAAKDQKTAERSETDWSVATAAQRDRREERSTLKTKSRVFETA